MLFGSLSPVLREQDHSGARRALLDQLVAISRKAFPDVEVLIHEASPSFNAQAFCIGRQKTVALFGGLAFNRHIGSDGLLFAILHEIGHHLAPGPRMTVTSRLSCDCAADRWVITEGQRAFSRHGLAMDMTSALSQLEQAMSELGGACPSDAGFCFEWARRTAALTSPDQGPLVECEYRVHFINTEGGKNGISDSERR
jgi:hypothetical protein